MFWDFYQQSFNLDFFSITDMKSFNSDQDFFMDDDVFEQRDVIAHCDVIDYKVTSYFYNVVRTLKASYTGV